jgi:Zn-dependent protease with chaperone function
VAYKGIRIVALASILMAVAWFGALVWATFWSGTEGEPVSYKTVSQALSFVLVLLATLASYVSQILERQADQIARLERDLAELHSTLLGSRKAG